MKIRAVVTLLLNAKDVDTAQDAIEATLDHGDFQDAIANIDIGASRVVVDSCLLTSIGSVRRAPVGRRVLMKKRRAPAMLAAPEGVALRKADGYVCAACSTQHERRFYEGSAIAWKALGGDGITSYACLRCGKKLTLA